MRLLEGTILKQTDNCVVQQVYDHFVGMDYVEVLGNLTMQLFPDPNPSGKYPGKRKYFQ